MCIYGHLYNYIDLVQVTSNELSGHDVTRKAGFQKAPSWLILQHAAIHIIAGSGMNNGVPVPQATKMHCHIMVVSQHIRFL